MYRLFFLFLLTFLTACNSTKESGLLKSTSLESPPEMQHRSRTHEQENNSTVQSSESEVRKGLNSDVNLVEGDNSKIKIKRNANEAWTLLGKAIRLNDLKIVKKNKDHGEYIVSYQASSFLGSFNLFGNGSESTYLIKLSDEGKETTVVVTLHNDEENLDSGSLKDGVPEYNYDRSSTVNKLIYETLRNDI